MSSRSKVAELDIARKAMRAGLKRDIALAKQEITPGALIGQVKERTKGKVERKARDAQRLALDNRQSLALGGLAAVATTLLAYATRRWKRRRQFDLSRTVPANPRPFTVISMENDDDRP